MRNRFKRLLREFNSVEKGHLFILTLLWIFLAALIIPPTLGHVHTTLKTERIYDEKTYAVYAADSGIEDAMWHIKEGDLATLLTVPTTYDPYDFETGWQYPLDEQINGDDVTVSVENIWIPEGLPDDNPGYIEGPDDADIAEQYAETDRLMVTGRVSTVPADPEVDPYTYEIKLTYKPVAGDALSVESIGAWLPDGFDYVEGSSSLEEEVLPVPLYQQNLEAPVEPYEPCSGGKVVIWNWDPALLYTALPGTMAAADTITAKINFDYTSSKQGKPPIVSWVKVTGVGVAPVGEDLTGRIPPYTWDADVRIFHLTSQAGEATVEARTAKNELRKMPAAINGDYVAAGATLMINNDGDNYLDAFVSGNQSSATVDSIPDDAQVELAYLYWSGWFANGTTIWGPDACADFSNWTRSSTPGNQTRVPTADGDISGTWNTAPCWDDVDETSPDDGNYMAGTTDSGGYKLFTFSPFTIPAGATVMNLTVYVRAKDVSSGTNNIRPSIKVNGTRYNTTATSVNPSTSFTTYSYAYSSNPNTGSPWTAEDVNGTGTCPLQQFGVYSSDLNPDIQVSMVYAQVNYEEAGWTISSGRFQGHYSGGSDAYRYLTKTVSTDLSAYATGAVYVYWDQYESGTLEATDGLDFQFSADGGSTWSGLITAFRDDLSTSAFSYAIPPTYLTAGFKMRFYLQGFGDSGEYCYIDNIKLTSLMPDTSVVFKINGEQVYLDGDGLATQGAVEVTAGRSSAMPNAEVAGSFSYACRLEVTKLLKAFSDEGAEGNHTGNATYTVGNVNATVNNDWSYAAWSILIIYSSAESYGHQLYLYDVFSYAGEDGNVDFDHDGQPGGTIGGFIVPDPIAAEVDAAKLSCFVGEGDNAYTGDYLRFNGTSLSNAQSPSNNVWNSNSPGLTQAGIDIDTFSISWASGLLEPGDTSAQIDMPTGNDSWNLVYTIISFRSETSTGGAITYLLEL